MKAFLFTLIALLISFTSRAEVIDGAEVLKSTSEPFQFGSPLVPLSILALVLSAGFIVFYTVRRRRAVEEK